MTKVLRNFLWTALITPFNQAGQVDMPTLTRLLKRQEEAGNGIFLAGSTGEGIQLSLVEKEQMILRALQEKLTVPLMVGIGGERLEEQLAWIGSLKNVPIDAFSVITPYSSRPGFHGQIDWFSRILDAAARPCMIYNHPGRTGVAILPEVIQKLADHPNFFAFKDSSGSLDAFRQFRKAAPEVEMFSGNDNMMWELAHAGAQGLIGVMSNVWPHATRRYVDNCLRGPMNDFITNCVAASQVTDVKNPVSSKLFLAKMGILDGARTRSPLHPLDGADEQKISATLAMMNAYEGSSLVAS